MLTANSEFPPPGRVQPGRAVSASSPDLFRDAAVRQTRRLLLGRSATQLGALALSSLLVPESVAAGSGVPVPPGAVVGGGIPQRAARARRVIWLFMHGAPSQLDLFDHKPELRRRHGTEFPASVRGQQRLSGMTSDQKSLPVAASPFQFRRHGESGAWVSELLPHHSRVVDDLCFVHTLHTEAINHDPATTLAQTGHQQPGRPCAGSWVTYGLGSESENLPSFVVLLSRGSASRPVDPLHARLWGSGFLPSSHQGVAFRSGSDPVLYLGNPAGVSRGRRRLMLDALAALNRSQYEVIQDPEIQTRIAQYEMAYRMQSSVPDLLNLEGEPAETFELYGPGAHVPGTFAANCLLARRLAERNVRFIQLYHRGWDQHYNLPSDLRLQCQDVDQACAALITDLRRRGLLDDTLVIWSGEFGRTTFCQGQLTATDFGRDHHPRCFTGWLAGGGVRGGTVYGETDEYCYNVVRDPIHVHDLNATMLDCLGVDHRRLTFRTQGRDFRLTDVHGSVVAGILR